MNKIKITILLLVSAFVLLFSSCGGMMVADTDNVSIDLSSVASKATTGDENNWVKIWLFPKSSVSPYTFSDGSTVIDMEIPQGGVITIENVPAGQVYNIYISLGVKEDDNDPFAIKSSYSGSVSVTGGTSTAATISNDNYADRGITPLTAYTGMSVKGAAVVNGTFYTVSEAGDKLYYGTETVSSETAASDFTFNSVDEGYNNMLIISSANDAGNGFVSFDGTSLDYTYSDGLASELSGAVDVLSADVFWDDDEQLQIILGYLTAGLVIGMSDADDNYNDWFALPLGDYIEDLGFVISKQLITSVTAVMQTNGTDITGALIYMLSEIGNYCFDVGFVDGELVIEGITDSDEDMDISALLNDFTAENALSERKLLNMVNTKKDDNDILYIGTDNGLYTASATSVSADMAPTLIEATSGKRIKYLAATEDYVACVTPLELIVMKISDSTAKTISFNEGLPVENGLLTNGLTGIDWDGTTLYAAGNYGVTQIDALQLW